MTATCVFGMFHQERLFRGSSLATPYSPVIRSETLNKPAAYDWSTHILLQALVGSLYPERMECASLISPTARDSDREPWRCPIMSRQSPCLLPESIWPWCRLPERRLNSLS